MPGRHVVRRPAAAPRGRPQTHDRMREVQAASVAAKRFRKAEKEDLPQRPPGPRHEKVDSIDIERISEQTLPGTQHILVPYIAKFLPELRRIEPQWDEIDDHLFTPALRTRKRISEIKSEHHRNGEERVRFKASLAWTTARALRRDLFDGVKHPRSRLRLVDSVDAVAYDEGSLPVRTHPEQTLAALPSTATSNAASSTEIVVALKKSPDVSGQSEAKLFVVLQDFGLLLSKQNADGEITDDFTILLGTTPTHVQMLKNVKAGTMNHALHKASAWTTAEKPHVYTPTRLCCSDRHPSNRKAERQLVAQRPVKSRQLQLGCELHMNATETSEMAEELPDCIRGMLHIHLSLKTVDQLAEFQDCFVTSIASRMDLVDGTLEPAEHAYAKVSLQYFMPGGKKVSVRKCTLHSARVNWADHSRVQVMLRDMTQLEGVDPEEFKRELAKTICGLLLPKTPRKWATKDWNGAEESCCDIAILYLFCGSLFHALDLYRERTGRKLSVVEQQLPPVGPHAHAAIADGPLADDGSGPAQGPGLTASEQERQQRTYAKLKETHDSLLLACTWMRRVRPTAGTQMIIWRLSLRPVQEHLRQLMYDGSKRNERKQRAKAAKATGADHPGAARDFRILNAARGTMEDACCRGLRRLLIDFRIWFQIPEPDQTNQTRALIFKTLMVAGAGNERFFRRPHSLYPVRAFLRLDGQHMGHILDNDRQCLRDPRSKTMFEECGGFTPKVAEARLLMIALLAYVENKRSEISMSVLRRFIMSRVQTHGIHIEDLGAEWLAHQIRNDGVEKLPGGMPTTTATAEQGPSHEDGDVERIPKKGCGGPYRQFLHERGQFQSPEITAAYHALDEEEKQRLREAGGRATHLGHEGLLPQESAVGPRPSRVKKAEKKGF